MLACIPHLYIGDNKEKWVTNSWGGLELPLKYHRQLKTTERKVGGGQLWEGCQETFIEQG